MDIAGLAAAAALNGQGGDGAPGVFDQESIQKMLKQQFEQSMQLLRESQDSNQRQSKELRDRIIHKHSSKLDPDGQRKLGDIVKTLTQNPDLIDPVGLFMGTLVVKSRENKKLVSENPELILELNRFLRERVAAKQPPPAPAPPPTTEPVAG